MKRLEHIQNVLDHSTNAMETLKESDVDFLIDAIRELQNALNSIEWITRYSDGSKDACRADRALIEKAISGR